MAWTLYWLVKPSLPLRHFRYIVRDSLPPGAAERGVQGVQLHTLEILWVCKTPFLRTLSQLTFAQQMLCLPAHNSKGRPRSLVCLSLNGVKRYGGRLRYLLGRLRTFRVPRSFSEHLGHWRGPSDSSHSGRLRDWRAPSDPGVTWAPKKLEYAHKTGGSLKYRRAPSSFGGGGGGGGRHNRVESSSATRRRYKVKECPGAWKCRVTQHMQ